MAKPDGVPTRTPKKKTQGIFDNLRKLPEVHPVEEILGLAPREEPGQAEPTPPTPRTSPTARTSVTPRTARTPRTPPTSIAPERDFTKVANSIVREAVAGGLFTGKSKQLYDFLYYRTRGAVVPTRSVRITKPKLMTGSHIGSERTLLKNLAHLRAVGLIQIKVTDGEHGGNEYTVFLPEEVSLPTIPTPRTPPTPPTPDHEHHTPQERGTVPPVESGVGDVGSTSVGTMISDESQTSSLRPQRTNDDDDAALTGLVTTLKRAAQEITGREVTPAESERWRELGDVLATEMKIAAARTTVSNAPAFLAEHLRRRLWKKDKKQMDAEQSPNAIESQPTSSSLTVAEISSCPDCGGSNWYYPEGQEKGIKRCRHERLQREVSTGDTSPDTPPGSAPDTLS
jgi:hypothetical protein